MSATWRIENNIFSHDDLLSMIPQLVQPYPPGIWWIEDNTFEQILLPTMIPRLVQPYPQGLWYVEDNQLKQSGLLDMVYMGAFYNCTNLRTATISPTVKSIGEYAFANTGLTSVTIASDCTYYPTSFPPGCTVNRYPEEE